MPTQLRAIAPVLAFAFVLLTNDVLAATELDFEPGDLIVATSVHRIPEGPPSTQVLLFDSLTRLEGAYAVPLSRDIAIDANGNLFVISGLSGESIRKFDRRGREVGEVLTTSGVFGSLAFDSSTGTMYTTEGSPGQKLGTLIQFDPDTGQILASESPMPMADSLAIDSRRCTLFFVEPPRTIGRFDTCQRRRMGNLVETLPGLSESEIRAGFGAGEMRVLTDGTLLVLSQRQIYRFDQGGNWIETYDAPTVESWQALADGGSNTFLAAGSLGGWPPEQVLVRFTIGDVSSVETVQHFPSSTLYIVDMATYEDVGAQSVADVPTLPLTGSILLGLILAFTGYVILGRHG